MEHIKWKTKKTEHIDIDTGEILSLKERYTNYILIRTERKVKINYNKTKGIIQYVKLYKLTTQLKLPI